ncbi:MULTISPECIES: hypothetical protein [Halomonadaceae]|uniref:Uncharacterized protein n=1 Tax=Vreelandella halophila TaxID=86177 RepID=A0A9X4YCC3_9GAMM|nr:MULTISPECIES: hypothetical protein [Halomonas]MYL26881.1 hypothetical protein [Halomonas utahensis]MYL74142.1 hypothetical protein [Halomonas sp. 22501_18_FS]
MADLHIEDFYRDTAAILIHLYNRFPRKGAVFVEDIAGDDEPDEFGLHSNRHMACFGTMLWLADEGLLRYESVIGQDAVDQAVLTAECFNRLSTQHPEGEAAGGSGLIREAALAVNRIRQCMANGTSTELSETVHRFLFDPPTRL